MKYLEYYLSLKI
jgi:hypothetical protein